jgi:hypothetical protein
MEYGGKNTFPCREIYRKNQFPPGSNAKLQAPVPYGTHASRARFPDDPHFAIRLLLFKKSWAT